jgi:hypothetical protein
MGGHVLVGRIETKLVAVGLSDTELQAVGTHQFCRPPKELEDSDLGANPVWNFRVEWVATFSGLRNISMITTEMRLFAEGLVARSGSEQASTSVLDAFSHCSSGPES